MLRRKMLAILLPTVAAATLVGSGFSAWYFGETVTTNFGQDVNVIITDQVGEVGEIVQYAGLNAVTPNYLILDQGTHDHHDENGYGISFSNNSVDSLGANSLVGATFTFTDGAHGKLTSAGLKVYFVQTITISNTLLNYVHVKDSALPSIYDDETASTGDTVTTYTLEKEITNPHSTDMTLDIGTTDYVNTILEYGGTEGKPTTPEDLSAMKTALQQAEAGKTPLITFSWTAVVK